MTNLTSLLCWGDAGLDFRPALFVESDGQKRLVDFYFTVLFGEAIFLNLFMNILTRERVVPIIEDTVRFGTVLGHGQMLDTFFLSQGRVTVRFQDSRFHIVS